MERDAKGRFVKGNTEGNRFTRGGNAADAARKATEVREKNRTVAEVLRAELSKKAGDGTITKLEYLVLKAISDHAKGDMTMKDLRDLQKILGEEVTTVRLEGPLVVSQEEVEALDRWSSKE